MCLLSSNKCRKCLTIRVEILRYGFAELQTSFLLMVTAEKNGFRGI